jgi:hypothetical protein
MATLKGDNRTNADASPSVKIDVRDQGGRLRVARDEITFSAETSPGDTIDLMRLPSGAKVYDFILDSEELTDLDDVDFGWKDNGVDSADATGFVNAADISSADRFKMSGLQGANGQYKKFGAETEVVAAINATSTAATGKKLIVEVHYVVD